MHIKEGIKTENKPIKTPKVYTIDSQSDILNPINKYKEIFKKDFYHKSEIKNKIIIALKNINSTKNTDKDASNNFFNKITAEILIKETGNKNVQLAEPKLFADVKNALIEYAKNLDKNQNRVSGRNY
jgi:hypothetical protein